MLMLPRAAVTVGRPARPPRAPAPYIFTYIQLMNLRVNVCINVYAAGAVRGDRVPRFGNEFSNFIEFPVGMF